MVQLGVEGFGVFNVVAGFVTMLGFVGTSMSIGIQRFFNYEIGVRGETAVVDVYSSALKIQIGIAVIIVCLFETIGLWYVNNIMNLPLERIGEINWLYQFAIVSLLLNMLVIPYSAFVMAKEHMNWYATISMIDAILKLLIVLSLSLFDDNRLAVYGFMLMMVTLFNFCSYYVFCKILYPYFKYSHNAGKNLAKPILKFSGWNILGSFANIGKTQGVNLLLNYFFGICINAANAIVTQIYGAVQAFSLNICMAFRPQLTESYAKKDFERSLEMMYMMSKCAFVMVATICIPLFLELPFVLHVWLGGDVPEHTDSFAYITLLVVLVGSLNTPVSQVVLANGNISRYMIIYSMICLCLPVGWIAFYMGAPAISIFWITLVLMIIIQVLSLITMKRYIDYSYAEYLLRVIVPCLKFIIFAPIIPIIVCYIYNENSWAQFISVVICSLIASVLIAFQLILSNSQKTQVLTKIGAALKR